MDYHGKQKLAVNEDLGDLLEIPYDIISIGRIETLVVGLVILLGCSNIRLEPDEL